MTTPFGPEFLVNTTTKKAQFDPAVVGLANGRFVAVWTDSSGSGGDRSDAAVRAQLFNADGSKAGKEFVVNRTTAFAQHEAAVTALDDGGFVVSWTDRSGASAETIRGQVFDETGARSGSEFEIPTAAGNENGSAIAGLANGGFVSVWTETAEDVGDHSGAAIHAQFFAPGGSRMGGEIAVNSTTAKGQYAPVVATLANGRVAMAWTDTSRDGDGVSEIDVRVRLFTAEGTAVDLDFVANATAAGDQALPSITALADGRFVVAWCDGPHYDARARIFDADGAPIGGEFTLGKPDETGRVLPQLAALPDGGFVATWADYYAASAGETVLFAQVFGADGEPRSDEFKVTRHPDSGAYSHSTTVLADGRFVVAWSGANPIGGDKSFESIHARIFDPRDEAIYLSGNGGADDFVGTRFADVLSGEGGRDRLAGGDGADRLDGGAGKDVLIGGGGKDTFQFVDALHPKSNVDRIADFGGKDQIALLADIFQGLGSGKLAAGAFFAAEGADGGHDRNDRIIYDTKSGALFYDADGSRGQAAIRFAVLAHAPDGVSASDFAIVA